MIDKIENSVDAKKETIEMYTTDLLLLRECFFVGADIYKNAVKFNIPNSGEYNNVFMLDDGHLTSAAEKANAEITGGYIGEFNEYLKEKNISFVYLQAPVKISEGDDAYGTIDFSNQKMDALLSDLDTRGVKYLDLRRFISEKYENPHDAFFVTDHHWKPETALSAANFVCEYLKNDMGFDIDLDMLNSDDYSTEVYKNSFLGSHGKKLGKLNCTAEDFPLLYPKFDTDISFAIPTLSIDTRGKFDVMYGMYYMNLSGGNASFSRYNTYIYSNNPLTHIVNHNSKNQTRVLLIGDSFKNCFAPFFSMGISELDIVDPRYFTGSIHSLIEQNDYDLVTLLVYKNGIGDVRDDTHTTVFDLR